MPETERLLPDGVYLGLEEEVYFAQDRLGSTDLCRLYLRKEGYWWASPMNPDFVPESTDTAAKNFGKALHALILEGPAAYRSRFGVVPTKDELRALHGEKFCITVKDMLTQLEARGMNPKASETKGWFIAYCKQRAPDLVIWDEFMDAWTKDNEGKLPVTSAEDRQLEIVRQAVHEHTEIGELFHPTATSIPLAEVSVLFTDEHGLRRRVRYDCLLPQHIIDLKAISNLGQRPLAFAVGDHVGKFAYPCQLADHQLARRWLLRMVAAGKVYGGTAEERAWLARFPAEAAPTAEYAWVFIQRPDPRAGQAPIVFPWIEDHGSDLHMDGIRMRRKAIQTYRECMIRFGPDRPWTRVEPVHTTAEGFKNRVFVPHWIAQEAMPGEEEDL